MLRLQRINPFNTVELLFMYETRFHPEVVKTLISAEKPNYDKHVEYLRRKDQSGHLFFICYGDLLPVGYCQCFSIRENVWELGWVVHPNHQGKGFGVTSVNLLVKEVLNMGGHIAELIVMKCNSKAFSIYQKSGFKILEDCGDSWRMSLFLL